MNASEEVRLYYLRRSIAEVNDAIVFHEMRAALPPANCTEIDLYAQIELGEAAKLKLRLASLRKELNEIEQQEELAFN